jgi:hypothetical protein
MITPETLLAEQKELQRRIRRLEEAQQYQRAEAVEDRRVAGPVCLGSGALGMLIH